MVIDRLSYDFHRAWSKQLAVLDKARCDWRRTQNCSFHRVPVEIRKSVFLALVFFYSEETPNSRGVLYLKLPNIKAWEDCLITFNEKSLHLFKNSSVTTDLFFGSAHTKRVPILLHNSDRSVNNIRDMIKFALSYPW